MLLLHARVIVISVAVMMLANIVACWSYGQSVTDQSIVKLTNEEQSLTGIALKLAAESHVPFGVEVAPGDQNRNFGVSDSEMTLTKELDRMMMSNPGYLWKMSSKVINVFPRNDKHSIFNVRVAHFEAKDVDVTVMIYNLLRDPAVAKSLAERKIAAQLWITGPPPKNKGSININNVTVREALNEILVKTQGAAWTAFYVDSEDPQTESRRMMFQVF